MKLHNGLTPTGAAKPGENRFKNTSGPRGEINPGNASKFTATQAEDRLRVHAISVATGSPTIPQIVEYYKEKYGIEIALQTEKAWRQSNRDRIEKKKMELIEKGEISIPVVSEEVLSDSMLDLTIQTSRLSKTLRLKAQTVLSKININGSKTSEERLVNAERMEIFKMLTDSLSKMNHNIKTQIDSLFAFSSKIKIKDKEIQKIVDKQFDERMKTVNEEDDIDELGEEEVEITDEVRQKLLED